MGDDVKNALESDKSKLYRNIAIASVIIIILGCISMSIFTKYALYNGRIATNTFIEEVNISGMTKEEAIKAVNNYYKVQNLKLTYKGDNHEIDYKDINLSYDTKKIVEKAYNSTRNGSYFQNIISYMGVKLGGKTYSIKPIYDDKKLNECMNLISEKVNIEPINAGVKIEKDNITYTDGKSGIQVEIEDTKKLILQALEKKKYDEIELLVSEINPKISTEDVKSIDTKLATFSTSFNASKTNRSFNIGLAAQKCDNVVLLPGETFSYNEKTGLRTRANGYLNAPVILNGSYASAPGGGVCQTSTTLFNAVLLSGLQIDTVRNHSKLSSYVPRGRDAMVSDNSSDLVFTNNFEYPVYIQCYRSGSTVNAAVYGSSKDQVEVSVNVDSFTYNGRPAAKTYRTISKNGESETSHIYTSIYR